MPVNTAISSGDRAQAASAATIPNLLVCCSAGTVGKVYSYEPGADVGADLGGGIGVDAVYAYLRGARRGCKVTVMAPTWSAAPSITHVGTGPTITCAVAADEDGPFDDHKFLLTITTGGAAEDGAAFSVCYDGATVAESVPIPPEIPAVLRGAVDITNGAVLTGYVANTLTPLHLDFTAPTADVITFGAGSLAASAAGLRAAFASSVAVQTWTTADLLDAGEAVILAHARKLLFTTTGATPADAPASCTITGTRYGAAVTEVLVLGQVLNDIVSSVETYTVITSIVFAAGDGNGALLALGYSSAYADAAEIVTDFDAAADAAGLAVHARIGSTSTAQYLELFSTSAGSAITQTISAGPSTADTPLGFTVGAANLTGTGAAATWSPAWTGLTFTFPATADYVLADTYSATSVGPRADLAAIIDAAIAAHDDYPTNRFGFLVVCQPAADAATAQAINTALASLTNSTWVPDAYAPIYVTSITGGPFHVASATIATNRANIATHDAAMVLAFKDASPNFDSVAVDDIYLPGASTLVPGSFRRTAAIAWAIKYGGKAKLAADVADGLLPEGTLRGPDGLTLARDASKQSTHLEVSGLGFSCLRSTSQGLGYIKFAPGYTRAGGSSRLKFSGVVTVCLEVATIVFPIVELWEGETDVTEPTTGQLTDNAKKNRTNQVYAAVKPTLVPDGSDPNCSDFSVDVLNPTTGRFVDNGEVRVRVDVVVLGEIITTFIGITATGVTTITV